MSGPYTNVDGEGGTYRVTLTAVLPNLGSDPSNWDVQALIEYLSITDYEHVSGVTSELARWDKPIEHVGAGPKPLSCDECEGSGHGKVTRTRPFGGDYLAIDSRRFVCHRCYYGTKGEE